MNNAKEFDVEQEEKNIYKKMYFHMVRETLKAQTILEKALQECEEYYISLEDKTQYLNDIHCKKSN